MLRNRQSQIHALLDDLAGGDADPHDLALIVSDFLRDNSAVSEKLCELGAFMPKLTAAQSLGLREFCPLTGEKMRKQSFGGFSKVKTRSKLTFPQKPISFSNSALKTTYIH